MDYSIFSKAVNFITNMLRENNFPINFTESINKTPIRLLLPYVPLLTVPKDLIYVKLPYLGTICCTLERKLKTVYTVPLFNAKLFKFKDNFQNFTCLNCL